MGPFALFWSLSSGAAVGIVAASRLYWVEEGRRPQNEAPKRSPSILSQRDAKAPPANVTYRSGMKEDRLHSNWLV